MKKNRLFENIVHGIFLILGLITVGCVLLITVYLIISGIPAIKEIGLFNFLFGKEWASTAAEPKYGILPFILTSVYGTAGAILIGVPFGFFTAVYLSKVANKKVRAVIEAAVNLLAGIPSVVYGLVGMLVLVPAIREIFNVPDGASLLAAIIVLAIMILPNIIKVSITALDAVPKEYEDASLALGATPTETFFKVSVPAAKSGIAAAVVLGVGRAIGEAMAVMMVAGNVANMPSLFESVRFLTTAVASEMAYSSPGSLQRNALFSIALVLFLFIMLINATLNFFLKRDRVVKVRDEIYIPFLENFLSKLTVTCFSASGWDNQLMWSHYANSYSGICVEYDFEKMDKFIGFMYPVKYSSVRPTVSLKDLGLSEFKKDENGNLITDEVNISAISVVSDKWR